MKMSLSEIHQDIQNTSQNFVEYVTGLKYPFAKYIYLILLILNLICCAYLIYKAGKKIK